MKLRLRRRLCVLVVLFVTACASSAPTPAISPTTSLTPPQGIAAPPAVGASASATASGDLVQAAGFADWVSRFRDTARAAGIDEATLHAAFDNVAFIPRVVDLDRAQPEFTRTVWAYLEGVVTTRRVDAGRDKLLQLHDEPALRLRSTACRRKY